MKRRLKPCLKPKEDMALKLRLLEMKESMILEYQGDKGKYILLYCHDGHLIFRELIKVMA